MRSTQATAAAVFAVAIAIVVIVILVTGGDDNGEVAAEREKPTVSVPDGDPPNELQVTDVEVGDGDEATSGSSVTVNYVGVTFSSGEEFDSSFDAGQPFTFQLGAGQVIPGWDEGVEGMQVGGRRELVIPPDLAYGEQGAPPAIGPDETLVFIVDLLEVGGEQ